MSRAEFDRAAGLQRAGHFEQAEALYRKLLTKNSNNPLILNNLGTMRRAQNRPEEALDFYRRAATRNPDHILTRNHLGHLLMELGRFAEAEPHLRRALGAAPADPKLLSDLGFVLFRQEKLAEAAASLQAARDLAPEDPAILYRHGLVLYRLNRLAEAITALEKLCGLQPRQPQALRLLAGAMEKTGRKQEALTLYERVLEIDPADQETRFLVQARRGVTVAKPPATYIEGLFDSYAARFEKHLIGGLRYHTPEHLLEFLSEHVDPTRRFRNVLDLGCGTGLLGLELRSRAERLTGIDLSPKMLDQARAKGLYDRLECAEIVAFLAAAEEHFDLVGSADVFIYLGDLDPVFAGVAARTQPGALFLFSTEHAESGDYALLGSSRFAHSRAYIERLAAKHGFTMPGHAVKVIRHESGRPLDGGLYLLRRNGPEAETAKAADAAANDTPAPVVGLRSQAATRRDQGRLREVVVLLEQALAEDPRDPTLHLELGQTLITLHDYGGAVRHLRRAAELAPDDPRPLIDMGAPLLQLGAVEEATTALRRAHELAPENPLVLLNLALAEAQAGETAHAGLLLGRIEGRETVAVAARYLERVLDGQPVDAAPPALVAGSYEQSARVYETHVATAFRNRAWMHLLDLLEGAIGPARRFAKALDLGCGTGLMGAAIRYRADHLTGVDFSQAMIEEATRRAIYDRLVTAELTKFLAGTDEVFDLVTAAEVLIHIGDLTPLFRSVADRLSPGGLFLLSTEHGEGDDCVPTLQFRFRHGPGHVGRAAATAGLVRLAEATAAIRREMTGLPVTGGLYLFTRPPS